MAATFAAFRLRNVLDGYLRKRVRRWSKISEGPVIREDGGIPITVFERQDENRDIFRLDITDTSEGPNNRS